jgi:epoxyqueuosine reductase
MSLKPSQYKEFIRNRAKALGFDYCGFAKSAFLEEDAVRLENWLNNEMHGKMQYMENHFDMRVNPSLLVPGAQSVITLLINYYPKDKQSGFPKVAKYAYGKDYHLIIREKVKTLLNDMRTFIGEVEGRGFVDSAPVLERAWALKSGLGWIGKNGNLLTKKNGSFFFIATLITDLEIESDPPFVTDHCGTCTKCIDACPTNAILPNKVVDGSKCISYYTIELKDEIIPADNQRFDNWMFGCDICQDVCPWNRFAQPTHEKEFKPFEEILLFNEDDWNAMNEQTFNTLFKESPLKRTKFKNMKRNLRFLKPVQTL